MVQRLRRFFDIRPGEGAAVVLAFLYIATVVASYLLAKPIRNGLFLKEYGAYRLVYVYAGVPVALTLFVALYSRIAVRVGHRRLVILSLWSFCAQVLLFWYGFRFASFAGLPAIFYIWVNCFGIIAPVQAWVFAGGLFDTRQARRLFGVIGGGASLGAIAGGFLGKLLVEPVGGTVNLLLVLAALIALAAMIVTAASRRLPGGGARQRRPRVPVRDTLRTIGASPYLRLIAALVICVAIATQWIGFQFSLVAEARFGADADRLTEFFSGFNFYLGVVAFAIQLLVTGPALRRFGLSSTILLLPALLAIAMAVVFGVPGFWPVVIGSAFDQGIRFSLDKASFELLYLPIPGVLRTNVKATIDIVINRVADAAGAVVLGLVTKGFLGLGGLDLTLRGTAAVTCVVTLVWLLIANRLRREYVVAIRENIHKHRIESERAHAAALDRSMAEALAAKLKAEEPSDVIYALDLLEAQPNPSHPALRGLLTHPSPTIRRRAVALLAAAGDRSARADIEPLIVDPDLDTRTEALLYLTHHFSVDPISLLEGAGEFADFSVRAGMVAFLASPGRSQNLEAAGMLLDAMVADPTDAAARDRAEAARLLERLPAGLFEPQLERLLSPEETEVDVLRHAIRAAGQRRARRLAPLVTARLGHPHVGRDAVDALGRLGDEVVGLLRELLQSPATPLDAKRAIPDVLVRIATPAAERALVETLLESDPILRHRIIASLNKLRRDRPDIAVEPEAVEMLLAAEIFGHYRSYQVLGLLRARLPEDDPVIQGLNQSMEQEVERLFRLLALLYPHEGLHDAYFGLRAANPSLRADALELLEQVLPLHLRQMLVPLLDSQISVPERVDLADSLVGSEVQTIDEAVGVLLASEDPWLRSCAAFAVGALRLETLAPELERLTDAADPLLRETARAARRKLSGEPVTAGPVGPQAGWAPPTGIEALGN